MSVHNIDDIPTQRLAAGVVNENHEILLSERLMEPHKKYQNIGGNGMDAESGVKFRQKMKNPRGYPENMVLEDHTIPHLSVRNTQHLDLLVVFPSDS